MRIYDVTVGISPQMPVWPGDPPVQLERVKAIAAGANANVSQLTCGVHSGTHVDAPLHFIDGASGIDSLPLKLLMGRAYVVNLPSAAVLDEATLEAANLPPRTRRILFRTRNSDLWATEKAFHKDFIAVNASGARWLVKKGVQVVGVDYLSVAPFGQSKETHRILLEAGVVVIEGLDLSRVTQGRYSLYCLPLKLVGSDGAPARVILVGV